MDIIDDLNVSANQSNDKDKGFNDSIGKNLDKKDKDRLRGRPRATPWKWDGMTTMASWEFQL